MISPLLKAELIVENKEGKLVGHYYVTCWELGSFLRSTDIYIQSFQLKVRSFILSIKDYLLPSYKRFLLSL